MANPTPTDTAPLLRGGSFQTPNLAAAHPREDAPYETPQNSTRTDEPTEGPQSNAPTEPPRASMDDKQASHRDDVPELPAGTASSVSIVKPEAPPSTHGRRPRGEALAKIREDLSSPRIKPLIFPFVCLVGGIVLALGHHLFNQWADGRTVGKSPNIPQQWILRVGTAFGFAFQTILAASLSFVVCQILWYYARRKYMTLQDLNTLYLVERRDTIPTFMSNAVTRAPFLVLMVTFSLMLPIAAIFSPASLSVVFLVTNTSGSCVVSAANVTDGINSTHIYAAEDGVFLSGVSGPALKITQRALVGGVIPSLPMFCGDNCIYDASMDSMTFNCQEGVTLPPGQMGTVDPAHPGPGTRTYWNATSDGPSTDPTLPFYVGWMTDAYTDGMTQYLNGTTGSAYCTPMLAHYNFSVQRLNGVQIVSYTTSITGPMSPATHYDQNNDQPTYAALQIGAIALAARNHLLGSLSVTSNPGGSRDDYNSSVISASFLNISTIGVESFIWGDVVEGIQETAANITASMLLLDLGGMKNSTCMYTNQDLVYSYHRLGLWIPYGIALLIVAVSLLFGVLIFLRFNPENLTTSLTDTIGITRSPTFETFDHKGSNKAGQATVEDTTRFRLGKQADGHLEFATQRDFT
ncbi:hypothetical protein FS837_006841 [Tulasnella sp. UAMH 9824]|nr:hypothetical protein FS837_006841 [Tulasnella sp. UAMH 9824]